VERLQKDVRPSVDAPSSVREWSIRVERVATASVRGLQQHQKEALAAALTTEKQRARMNMEDSLVRMSAAVEAAEAAMRAAESAVPPLTAVQRLTLVKELHQAQWQHSSLKLAIAQADEADPPSLHASAISCGNNPSGTSLVPTPLCDAPGVSVEDAEQLRAAASELMSAFWWANYAAQGIAVGVAVAAAVAVPESAARTLRLSALAHVDAALALGHPFNSGTHSGYNQQGSQLLSLVLALEDGGCYGASASSSSSSASSSSSSPLPACARWPLRASGGSKAHAFSPVYELKGSRLAVFWRAAGLEALATFLETHKTDMSRMTSNIHYRCDGNSQQLQTLKTYGLGDAPQLQEALRLVRVLFGHYQGSSGPRTPPLLDRPAANPAWSCSCPVLPASELDEAWDRLEKARHSQGHYGAGQAAHSAYVQARVHVRQC